MATKSVAKLQPIERETGDIGLAGLLSILKRRSSTNDCDNLDKLTDEELVTVRQQADNVTEGSLSGLQLLGDLVSAHDANVNDIDTNSLGWLIGELTCSLEQMDEIRWSAQDKLQKRGYDFMGRPLKEVA